MKPNRAIKLLLTVAVLACGMGFAATSPFYIPAAGSPYFALTLISVVVICLRRAPSLRTGLQVLLAGAALTAELRFFVQAHLFSLVSCLSCVGLGSLLIIAARAVWAEGDDRKGFLLGFAGAFLLAAVDYFGLNLLRLTEDPGARALDLYLYSFDASLHVQPAFLVGQAFEKWIWLNRIGLFFYIGLFIPLGSVYAGQLLRNRRRALEALTAFVIAAPLGILFYRLFPAIGPLHAFPKNYPWRPLTFSQASNLVPKPFSADGLKNAMPSLHMTWVLLACWFSRGLSWWDRALAILFAGFTVLATLGTGEHYAIDLVVAFPFALSIQYLCSFSLSWKDEQRLRACFYGLLLTLAWLVMLRYEAPVFWINPFLPWTACILTVGFSNSGMKIPGRIVRSVYLKTAAAHASP